MDRQEAIGHARVAWSVLTAVLFLIPIITTLSTVGAGLAFYLWAKKGAANHNRAGYALVWTLTFGVMAPVVGDAASPATKLALRPFRSNQTSIRRAGMRAFVEVTPGGSGGPAALCPPVAVGDLACRIAAPVRAPSSSTWVLGDADLARHR